MSWWVYLEGEDEKTLSVITHEEGGTYCMGGCDEAELNITYNYSTHFYRHLDSKDGLKWLNGKRASKTVNRIEGAIKELGVKSDADYWKSSEGNSGYALSILCDWAKQHPKGIWRVS